MTAQKYLAVTLHIVSDVDDHGLLGTECECCLCSGSRDQSVIVWDLESFARKHTLAISEVVLFIYLMMFIIKLHFFIDILKPALSVPYLSDWLGRFLSLGYLFSDGVTFIRGQVGDLCLSFFDVTVSYIFIVF